MREGWEYKRFNEVFDLQMGKTPSRDNPLYWGGNNIWVSIADLQGKYIGSSKEGISDTAVSESGIKMVPKDTVIMSFKLSVGRSAITTTDLYTNEAIMSFSPKPEYIIIPDYIYYYLKGYKWVGANKAVMGMTLNKKSISSNIFAIPEYKVQQQIVSELDLLSGAIEKQKTQLEELDKLAQSIFYDMFGDPETNNMGWMTEKLESLVKSLGGGTPSKNIPEYWDGDIAWVTSKDMKQTYISDSQIHITKQGLDNSPAQLLPIGTILLVNRSGILKHTLPVAITTKELTINQDLKALVAIDKRIENIFLLYSLKAYTPFLLSKVKAVTVDSIDFIIFKKLSIPLPPLALQQEFAAKVEAIESMKAKVRQSLTEAETLFNSRMDYFFN